MADIPRIDIPEGVVLPKAPITPSGPLGVKVQDLRGKLFQCWTADGFVGFSGNCSSWLCTCKCGVRAILSSRELTSVPVYDNRGGHGCVHQNLDVKALYERWRRLRRKGKMCKEWADDFNEFANRVGVPSSGTRRSLVRPDKSKPLSPTNFRWETLRKETDRELTLDGKTMTAAEWAKKLGMTRQGLHNRLKLVDSGETTLEEALTKTKHNGRIKTKAQRKPIKRIKQPPRVVSSDIEALADGNIHHVYSEDDRLPDRARYIGAKLDKQVFIRRIGNHHLIQFLDRVNDDK